MQDLLTKLSQQFSIITISGPRQSGKSTLAKMLFSQKPYVSLENLEDRNFASEDPIGFLKKYSKGAIIDEFQRCPQLASYLQTEVDQNPQAGRFILTGSGQYELLANVSQSLAGRTAIVRLLPFTLQEAYLNKIPSIDNILLNGFYPRLFDVTMEPFTLYSNYIDTYLEKDIRALLNVKDLSSFELFLKLCAARTGQIINFVEIGTQCGVSHNTIRSWVSVLESSFIIKLLRPYYTNISKRLIKAPKLYFLDTGLAANLMGIRKVEHLQFHPLRGALFETFVVGEFIKYRYNSGLKEDIYYLRDNKGYEVDLVLDGGEACHLCEIKSGQTITGDFFKNIHYYSKSKLNITGKYIVYAGTKEQIQSGVQILPFTKIETIEY